MYPNECCNDIDNLELVLNVVERPEDADTLVRRTIKRCKVCGRNHYEFEVEPVQVGLEVKPL